MLSLDTIRLGVPEVADAQRFYADTFVPADVVAVHGAEELAADAATKPATSGFRGYVMSYVVSQPSEVRFVLDAAVRAGATVLKPAKKSLFGAFSAVYQAPDGAIWKLSAPTKKDTGPAAEPPAPTETAALLGVAEPKATKEFYTALGMTADRDYGNKYIDFRPTPGTARLALMTRPVLAKDVGVAADGSGFSSVVLGARAESPESVEAILAAAASAGGRVVNPAVETEQGGYAGSFADPDGFVWQIAYE
ncbi:putative lactoylglutathione lyase [Tamaricihabitans halophyticus]|uniref:Putative lactoylglutathione lyase n=2 Tax=Tamaricihabitans halophyticus TaxID=1262583 RepID=A0A4R2R2A0_9PSEU|nr:putative lactoylglutathione lyase [Tamaricihabitans halophyticus]